MKKNLNTLDTKKYNNHNSDVIFESILTNINESEELSEDELFEDELFEDEENSEKKANDSEKKMSEEDLKIESLKIATNVAKLMSDVTTDDIIVIADKIASFIRNHEIGGEEKESKDLDFDLEETNPEESKEAEESSESEEENKE